MTLNEAIEKALGTEIYHAVKGHLSPPEILKIAALECFLHKQEDEVEDVIRAGMIFLDATGLMPKQ